MGRILTHVTIVNALDPAREFICEALVDTGAWGLMLPRAWKERLGALQVGRTVARRKGSAATSGTTRM